MIAYYEPEIITAFDYYPFGMMSRMWYDSDYPNYRFGFNGKEMDHEAKGNFAQLDYGMRVYDPRCGCFLSVDPLTKQYPWLSPYQYAENSPISHIDLDGLETQYAADGRKVVGPYTTDPLTGGPLYAAPPPGTFAYFVDQSKKPPQPSAAQPKLIKQDVLHVPAQVKAKKQMIEGNSLAISNKRAYKKHLEIYGYDPRIPFVGGPSSPGQDRFQKTDPLAGRSDFERGMITSPATQASALILCPGCAFTYGTAQVYSGIETGNYLEATAGVLNIVGGGAGLAAKYAPGSAGAQLAEAEAASGGHFLSRHGAQTSLSSQYTRAISGLTPDGVVLKEVNATRFFSENYSWRQ